MIKEGYIANWHKYPKNEIKIRVARPSILAPSKKLWNDYKQGKITWYVFENCFLEEILNNPKALLKLREIAEISKTQDVRLMCYEKSYPCHRFLLMDIIEALQGKVSPFHVWLRKQIELRIDTEKELIREQRERNSRVPLSDELSTSMTPSEMSILSNDECHGCIHEWADACSIYGVHLPSDDVECLICVRNKLARLPIRDNYKSSLEEVLCQKKVV